MPTSDRGAKSDLAKVVERQMRNWELARAQRVLPPEPSARPPAEPFVTVSRTVGSGGSEVANLLGERIGWPVFDREILQAMAGDDQVRARLYEQMDERDSGWLDDMMKWIVGGSLPRDDYFYRLTETILTLARQGHAIFLGRAADLILPRERGLRVRVVASAERRVANLQARAPITADAARTLIDQVDREREDFRRRHFGKDANDITRHDLVVTLDRLSAAEVVDVIISVLRSRGLAA